VPVPTNQRCAVSAIDPTAAQLAPQNIGNRLITESGYLCG
jgi:hypothetical protein